MGTIMATRVVLTARALTVAPAAVPPTVAPATIPAPDYVLTSSNLTNGLGESVILLFPPIAFNAVLLLSFIIDDEIFDELIDNEHVLIKKFLILIKNISILTKNGLILILIFV